MHFSCSSDIEAAKSFRIFVHLDFWSCILIKVSEERLQTWEISRLVEVIM